MGEATKIIRTSIRTFFNGYHPFITVAILFVFPFSTSTLFSYSLISSSPLSLRFVSSRFRGLLQSASFPVSSHFFSILNVKLSQTLFSAIFTLPFALTFLVLAKGSIIQITRDFPLCKRSPPSFSSLLSLYSPLLTAHIFNYLVIISVNATVFALFFLVFNAAELIGLSSSDSNFLLATLYLVGSVIYSVAITSTIVVCNLAVIAAGMEIRDRYISVLMKVCVLIKGRIGTALAIALPSNLAMAAIEALFQYRVTREYRLSGKLNSTIACEAFTIGYIHSVIVVVEIIASCVFYKGCKAEYRIEFEPEEKGEV